MRQVRYLCIALALIAGIAGCAGERYHREGLNLLAQGKTDEGLANLERAIQEEPTNAKFRAELLLRRSELVSRYLAAAEADRSAGKLDGSEAQYKLALKLEPDNPRAVSGLAAIDRDRRHLLVVEQAKDVLKKGDSTRAAALLNIVLTENPGNREAVEVKRQIDALQVKEQMEAPTLRISQKKPISLEFRDADLKIVFEALARTTGVDFILDKDVRPDLRTTVFLRQSSLEDAIDLILQTNRLEKKVLNANTILIYPSTPEKLKEYQELVMRGFYLANADVKQTQAMIKGMLKTKDIYIDEKLNLLIMRDTPDAIRLAEKLVAMQDMVEPEVMLEVEVLEVQRSRLLELGVKWPSQLTLTPLGTGGTTTLSDLRNLNSDRIAAAVPSTIVNLRREIGDANILANPRIRARNREKAKIMIGDKVPVVTSNTTATGVISESVQYLDVGLKLEVEPNVYLQDEVAIKIGLEVSSIVRELRTPGGSLAYQIGSRSASTVLRLKDGETQVLAGLISDEDRTAASRVPGLGDVPVVGRLFSSQKDDHLKTEIVLSITPRLVRNINRPEMSASQFWSGTEASLRTLPLKLQSGQTKGDGKAAEPSAPAGAAKADVPAPVATSGNSTVTDKANSLPEPTTIALSLHGPAQVKVGEQFKVAVKMKSDGGVRSLPFQLGYDPAVLQAVSVAEGGFFKQQGAQTSMSNNVDQTTGKVFVSVVQSGTGGAMGEEDVAIVTLRALAAKPGELKLLSASPITVGDKALAPVLPPPFVLNIAN